MKRWLFGLLATILLGLIVWSPARAAPVAQGDDCEFFTETGGGQGGYYVCNDGDARFLAAFEQWGLQKIGYPISQRYRRDGFVTQAFQKAIMQWRADTNQVVLVNIFDDLHNDSFDEKLIRYPTDPRATPRRLGWRCHLRGDRRQATSPAGRTPCPAPHLLRLERSSHLFWPSHLRGGGHG